MTGRLWSFAWPPPVCRHCHHPDSAHRPDRTEPGHQHCGRCGACCGHSTRTTHARIDTTRPFGHPRTIDGNEAWWPGHEGTA